ncbi:MAG: EamA family transporter RarD [Deltaproteobacteria bacterium]|nr:MAG: EamA family transporter RarD [Deltaproteobacteria bacterium]
MQRRVSESRRGLAHGIAAYGLWGLAPAFWKLLGGVSPVEILAHRVVWGVIAFAAIAGVAGVTPAVRAGLRDRRTAAMMAASGVLLVVNWGMFVWAVATDHILDASLGYFVIPLLSVALGTLVLGERLRRLSWIAIGCAVTGVAVLTWSAGRVPWISLVESLAGSPLETALLTPIAVGYLAVLALRGGGQLGHATTATQLLLVSTGLVTAAPLLLFNSAARRLPLSTLGFLQYLGPTCQFILAVGVYGEPFARDQLLAFAFIWIGLAVFSVDLVRQTRSLAVSRTGR